MAQQAERVQNSTATTSASLPDGGTLTGPAPGDDATAEEEWNECMNARKFVEGTLNEKQRAAFLEQHKDNEAGRKVEHVLMLQITNGWLIPM